MEMIEDSQGFNLGNAQAAGKLYADPLDPGSVNNSRSMLFRYVEPGSVVLDVGCSVGQLGAVLRRHKECLCHGLDCNAEAVARAVLTQSYESVRQIDLNRLGDGEYSDFVGKFDYIICGDVLEHLYDPENVLRVMLAYLKPGGSLLLSLPNLAHASIKANLLLDDFRYTEYGILDSTHIRFFTHKSISFFLAQNRLVLEDVDYTVMDLLGFQPQNPYPDMAAPVKMAIYSNPHSFICQYVMKARQAHEMDFAACLEANARQLYALDEKRNPLLAAYQSEALAACTLTGYLWRAPRSCFRRMIKATLLKGLAGFCLIPASLVYAGGPSNWLRRMRRPKGFLAEVASHSFLVTEKIKSRPWLRKLLLQRLLDAGRTLKRMSGEP